MAQPNIRPVEAFPASRAAGFENLQEFLSGYEEGAIVEVPLEFIDREEVPVDERRVNELTHEIRREALRTGGSGQLISALLAHVPGRDKLAIADGFHRATVLDRLERTTCLGNIRLNVTEEELADLRIKSANSHQSVSFARQVEWMGQVWGLTQWAGEGFEATRAFDIAVGRTKRARKDLSHQDVNEIKRWVETKCREWNVAPEEMYRNLVAAQAADPQLVREVRNSTGRSSKILTPAHLAEIVNKMPFDYQYQGLVAAAVKELDLTVGETKRLAADLENVYGTANAQQVIDSQSWRKASTAKRPSLPISQPMPTATVAQRPMTVATPEVQRAIFTDQLSFARLAIENVALKGRYVAAPLDVSHDSMVQTKLPVAYQHLVAPQTEGNRLNSRVKLRQRHDQISIAAGRYLATRFEVSAEIAEAALTTATTRLELELYQGALRYVEFTDDRQYDLLLLAAAKDDLTIDTRSDELTTIKYDTTVEPLEVAVSQLVEALPKLRAEQRQALVLSAAFQLSPYAIGQVMRLEKSSVTHTIGSALVAVVD